MDKTDPKHLYLCTCLSVCFTLCCVFIPNMLLSIVICIQIGLILYMNFALQWIFVIFLSNFKELFHRKMVNYLWHLTQVHLTLLPKQFVMIVFLLSLVYCFQPVITMFFIVSYLFGVSTTVTWIFVTEFTCISLLIVLLSFSCCRKFSGKKRESFNHYWWVHFVCT